MFFLLQICDFVLELLDSLLFDLQNVYLLVVLRSDLLQFFICLVHLFFNFLFREYAVFIFLFLLVSLTCEFCMLIVEFFLFTVQFLKYRGCFQFESMFFGLNLFDFFFLLIFYLFQPFFKNVHCFFSLFFGLWVDLLWLFKLIRKLFFYLNYFLLFHFLHLLQLSLVNHTYLDKLLLKLEVFFNLKINLFFKSFLYFLSLFEMSFV